MCIVRTQLYIYIYNTYFIDYNALLSHQLNDLFPTLIYIRNRFLPLNIATVDNKYGDT